jgi:hypothetical protein
LFPSWFWQSQLGISFGFRISSSRIQFRSRACYFIHFAIQLAVHKDLLDDGLSRLRHHGFDGQLLGGPQASVKGRPKYAMVAGQVESSGDQG